MVLPQLKDFNFQRKKVLVRCDLDVPLIVQSSKFPPAKAWHWRAGKVQSVEIGDDERIRECFPTIQYLLEHGASLVLMGHLGRPEGKVVEKLKLRPVAEKFKELLDSKFEIRNSKFETNTNFQIFKNQNFTAYQISESIVLLENLRFDTREENNNEEFAKKLASMGDFYVNEAFATSHREHTSIVGIPKFLPHCAGLHFASEVENLSKILENPQGPVVFVIGGVKSETKLPLVYELSKKVDHVLVGGALVKEQKTDDRRQMTEKIIWGKLTEDGLDIDNGTTTEFSDIIRKAGTVVWNGPMGRYEDEKWEAGTREIAEAVAGYGPPSSGSAGLRRGKGFSVVGGGDTITALKKFGLLDKIDYVSTGGGAMLEFLAKGTLPGILAIKINK